MTDEIKCGQVWADKRRPAGLLRVEHAHSEGVEYTWLDTNQNGFQSRHEFRNSYKRVGHVDEKGFVFLDQPLDPKSVHVGDTVTVRFIETGDVVTTKAYQPDDVTASGEYVYILGWPLHRANGTFGLAVSHFEILAIEPAPEPEPEWDGFGSGVVEGERVSGYVSPTGYFYSPDVESPRGRSEVTDFRPLALIDPAAGWWAEIHNALVAAGIGNAGSAASIALRTLGIEATS